MYALLAQSMVVLHFALLFYLLVGGFLAARWWWMAIPHALYVGWAVLTLYVAVGCPVTTVENWARHRDGQVPDDRPFMYRYVEGVLYPEHHINYLRAVFVVVILLSWAFSARKLWNRRKARQGATAAPLSVNVFPDQTSVLAEGSTGPHR
ncbi:DUF2784 domain-containing protein [Amycolatopsis sp. AA4]|uniref:DUF2784 domain-containing protein n=1 Tax=Actinomycetes TaxID=1760 RepID=UPI0001DEDF4F|nr:MULTISPECIES: DUF2784 domain-containing protein [Actinomycetes]ATY09300.1 DUF2784 domain-containing protein [Amycolatopsis sp. AA4]EFL04623.1 predicted protein [Streptomyces sp. AA4]